MYVLSHVSSAAPNTTTGESASRTCAVVQIERPSQTIANLLCTRTRAPTNPLTPATANCRVGGMRARNGCGAMTLQLDMHLPTRGKWMNTFICHALAIIKCLGVGLRRISVSFLPPPASAPPLLQTAAPSISCCGRLMRQRIRSCISLTLDPRAPRWHVRTPPSQLCHKSLQKRYRVLISGLLFFHLSQPSLPVPYVSVHPALANEEHHRPRQQWDRRRHVNPVGQL